MPVDPRGFVAKSLPFVLVLMVSSIQPLVMRVAPVPTVSMGQTTPLKKALATAAMRRTMTAMARPILRKMHVLSAPRDLHAIPHLESVVWSQAGPHARASLGQPLAQMMAASSAFDASGNPTIGLCRTAGKLWQRNR